jgi:hypothetical protein
VVQRLIAAHLRSESPPNATRFALEYARRAGGDVLWLAYVPEGLHPWLRRFADASNPSSAVAGVYRVARLFGSPTADEIALLAERIRDAGRADRAMPTAVPAGVSSAVAGLVEEIERGQLHVTTIVIDIHHLPDFVRRLRDHRTPGSPASIRANLRSLVAKLRAARLHVLFTTAHEVGAAAGVPTPGRRAGADIVDFLDDELDTTVVVDPARFSEMPQFFLARIERSRDPLLPVTREMAPVCWDDLLAPSGPCLPWADRLRVSCPRLDDRQFVEPTEGARAWTDPTQREFAGLATERGWQVKAATSQQDRREHWDLRIRSGEQVHRVDVKGQSRVRRSDPDLQDDWHWVELRGIVDDGWLFGGASDLIAFRTAASFVLVRRADLIDHVRHHVDPDAVVDDPRDAVYRVYHRIDGAGREGARPTGADRGVLTLVPTNRLRQLAWDEWAAGPITTPGRCRCGSQRRGGTARPEAAPLAVTISPTETPHARRGRRAGRPRH